MVDPIGFLDFFISMCYRNGTDHFALHFDSVYVDLGLGNVVGAAPSPRKQILGVGKAPIAPWAALPQCSENPKCKAITMRFDRSLSNFNCIG